MADKTQGDRDRELMNEVLKKHTVCGELVLRSQTKAEFLADHTDPQCRKDLALKADSDRLQTIDEAIHKQAEKIAKSETIPMPWPLNTSASQPPLWTVDANAVLPRLYRATDEVLGVIPQKDWKDRSDAPGVVESALQKVLGTEKPLAPLPVPDNGLVCTSMDMANVSITNMVSCKKEPKTR